MNNDSECWIEDMTLNAKQKIRLWTPRWRCDFEWRMKERLDDSECWTKKINDGSERRTENCMMALNAELEINDGSEHQIENEQRL